jgi:hypothetical protein
VQFLANKGPALEGFVCGGLVSLLARLTKLGWFENPTQDITKDVNQFLTVSVDHCIIGLQVASPRFLQEFRMKCPRDYARRTLTSHKESALRPLLQPCLLVRANAS